MGDAPTCPCLIAGSWIDACADRFSEVHNPSTGRVIARLPLGGPEEVNRVVKAAVAAFPAWRDTPAVERARVMFRFRSLLLEHADEISRTISLEHGKTFAEAGASVQRGIEMIEFACGLPSLLVGETMQNIAPDVDCETHRYPLGVVAGITPFNFPARVPLWMFPVALTCGNCFVLKPSPRVPLTANRMGELLIEAGIPSGVFSIVHGDKTCVDAILAHPDIRAVSFVGSTEVAQHVYQNGTAAGKRVQAAGGAKNHIVIMPDADMDAAVRGLGQAAFGCAGERCMAGSLAVPVGDAAEALVSGMCETAGRMTVGRTDTGQSADMGPLVSHEHLQRVRGYIDRAEEEGAEVVLDGRRIRVADAPDGYFLGPTVIDHVSPESPLAREEIFGPVLSVSRVTSLDDALELTARSPYGNGAVIFTRSGRTAHQFKRRANAGMIGINVAVPAPMAWFPFTGLNRSFFGDLHMQGREGMLFYTQQRMTMSRWPAPSSGSQADPIWRPPQER